MPFVSYPVVSNADVAIDSSVVSIDFRCFATIDQMAQNAQHKDTTDIRAYARMDLK